MEPSGSLYDLPLPAAYRAAADAAEAAAAAHYAVDQTGAAYDAFDAAVRAYKAAAVLAETLLDAARTGGVDLMAGVVAMTAASDAAGAAIRSAERMVDAYDLDAADPGNGVTERPPVPTNFGEIFAALFPLHGSR